MRLNAQEHDTSLPLLMYAWPGIFLTCQINICIFMSGFMKMALRIEIAPQAGVFSRQKR